VETNHYQKQKRTHACTVLQHSSYAFDNFLSKQNGIFRDSGGRTDFIPMSGTSGRIFDFMPAA
jgi:hypothetical protein